MPSIGVKHETTQGRSWPLYARWSEHTQLQLKNPRLAWVERPGPENYSHLHEKLGAGVGELGGEGRRPLRPNPFQVWLGDSCLKFTTSFICLDSKFISFLLFFRVGEIEKGGQ